MPESQLTREEVADTETLLSTETFDVRIYKAGDEHEINRGFNEIFNHKRSIEEWYWKFQPELDDCWIALAHDKKEELIAHFAVVRQPVQVFGKIHCAGQAMDVYRLKRPGTDDQPVFTITVKEFYKYFGKPDKISFLFGFPGKRHMDMGRDRLSYADPIPVPLLRRTAKNKRLWWSRYRVENGATRETLDMLWHNSAVRYPVCVVRDGHRLERRYSTRPGSPYMHLTVWRNGEPSAWAAFRKAGKKLQWIDLLWDGKDDGSLAALDHEAGKLAQSEGLEEIEMWLAQDQKANAVLERRGWRQEEHPQKLHMTSISFDPAVREAELLKSFYFTMGDSDLV